MTDEKPQPTPEAGDRAISAEMARRTRRSFITGGIAALAGLGVWEFVRTSHREGQTPWPLRQALETNEQLSRGYFRPARLAPQFPVSAAEPVKVN
ncbi:MAG TPA: hypothetical protein VFA04_21895, partial [Bryobacteraceae bacterium]|nr:hypothetical protein [Bryobacteraceae bacterium]